MNPKQTYTSSLYGSPALQALTAKKKPVTFGLPSTGGGIPSPAIGNTANSTPALPKSVSAVNSANPTASMITPSSPGATGTNQGSNAPAASTTSRTTSLPPAGVDYAKTLSDIQGQLINIKNTAANTTPAAAPKKEESEYLKYLRTMFNPDEAKLAQENVNNLNKMQADEISRNRKEQERIQKNEAGVIERGQTYLSSNADRSSAKALADIAIAKGYNTDILNQFTEAGKSLYEAEEAMRKEAESPLTLEESQALGVPFGTTMAEARLMGITPTDSGGTSGVASLAQMVMSGEMDMSGVPAELRGAVADAVQNGGGITDKTLQMSPYQQERITRNLSSIEDLMGQVSGWNTGMGSLIAAIPGTPAANFKADVNTLAANIAFGELTAMREASKTGGALGAVSERELSLLESALGSLDRAQSPAQFKESLNTIKESIQRWQAATQQYGGGSSSGGTNQPVQLPDGTVIDTNW